MPIAAECDDCGRAFKLGDDLAGKKFRCKDCGAVVSVPTADPESEASRPQRKKVARQASTDEDDAPTRSRRASRPNKSAKRRPAADDVSEDDEFEEYEDYESDDDDFDEFEDDYDEPPRRRRSSADKGERSGRRRASKKKRAGRKKAGKKKKKKSSGGGLGRFAWNFNRLNLGLIIGGCVVIVIGFNEFRMKLTSQVKPQNITLAKLLSDGSGDNIYLNLSGVFIREDFVFEGKSEQGPFQTIWAPAQPLPAGFNLANGAPPQSGVKIIIKSSDCKTMADVNALATKGALSSIEGMIVNDITSLGSEEKRLLKSSYENVNFDDCLIFEVGRTPAGMFKVIALWGFGGLLILAGLAWVLFVYTGE